MAVPPFFYMNYFALFAALLTALPAELTSLPAPSMVLHAPRTKAAANSVTVAILRTIIISFGKDRNSPCEWCPLLFEPFNSPKSSTTNI